MEFVYVVNRRTLFDLATPHGFVGGNPPEGHPHLDAYVERIVERGYFVERAYTEQHAWMKQIIPYTLVVFEDSVFLVRRLPAGGEARLYGKRSIGMGGHINPEDDNGDRRELVKQCARRELGEELIIDTPYDIKPVGIINDDANPVGAVHFGLVQVARVKRPEVAVRETDVLEGAFVPIEQAKRLLADPDANFETWSSLILEKIEEVLQQ